MSAQYTPMSSHTGTSRTALRRQIACAALLAASASWSLACGSKTGLLAPLPPPEVAAGDRFTCVRFPTGIVRCWGENSDGQLGDGTVVSRATPADVIGITRATRISARSGEACARMDNGTARCWGRNTDGAGPTPTALADLAGIENVQFLSGAECALLSNRTVQCRGHAYGRVFGFQLNATLRDPVLPATPVPGVHDVMDLSCDYENCGVILADGTIRLWGTRGISGTLYWEPAITAPLESPTGARRIALFTTNGGAIRFCALLDDRTLRCPEFTSDPATGLRATWRLIDPGLTDVTQVVAGGAFVCALVRSGDVHCWGDNQAGQLGDGTTTNRLLPVRVLGLHDVRSIAAGGGHACAMLRDYRVMCWGSNGNGELGDGTYESRSTPVFANIGAAPRGEAVIEQTLSAPRPPRGCLPEERPGYDMGCTADRMTPICRVQDPLATLICDCHGNTVSTRVWPPTIPFSDAIPCRPRPRPGEPVPCGMILPIEGDLCSARDRDEHALCAESALRDLDSYYCAGLCRCDDSMHWRCDPLACVDPSRSYRCEGGDPRNHGSVYRCVVSGP